MRLFYSPALRSRLLAACLFVVAFASAPVQAQNFSGSLNSSSYTWNRMSVINQFSGQIVPYFVYTFQANTVGTYTVNVNTTGFDGAINMYSPSFDPDAVGANFLQNGEVAFSPGPVSQSVIVNFVPMTVTVIISARLTGMTGSFTGSVTGPAAVVPSTSFYISKQPQSQAVAYGQTVSLSVFATGNTPHTFQWYEGTSGNTANPISGANSPNYTSPPLNTDKNYWVRVTKDGVHLNSTTAQILAFPSLDVPYSGTLTTSENGWIRNGAWRYFKNIRFRAHATGSYTATMTSPTFGPEMNLTGAWSTGNSTSHTVTRNLTAGQDYDLSVMAQTPLTTGSFSGIITGPQPVTIYPEQTGPPVIDSPARYRAVPIGTVQNIQVTAEGTKPFITQWYKGNSGDTSQPINGANNLFYDTPAITANSKFWVRVTNGQGSADSTTINLLPQSGNSSVTNTIDAGEPTFNRPLSYTTLSNILSPFRILTVDINRGGRHLSELQTFGFQGCITAYHNFNPTQPLSNMFTEPEFTGNPVMYDQQITVGRTYYVISGVNPGDSGTFTFTIRHGTSPSNLPTIIPVPQITSQPQSAFVAPGGSANLSVGTSEEYPQYQWYQGGLNNTTNPIAGANGPTLATPAINQTTSFWCRVHGEGGYTDSSVATVFIANPPNFTTQPQGTSILAGQTATLTSAAVGLPSVSYQWYRGTAPDTSNPVNGATSPNFTTPPLETTTSYWVRASVFPTVFTNSNTATVTVDPRPVITLLTVNPTLVQGGDAVFVVVKATDNGSLSSVKINGQNATYNPFGQSWQRTVTASATPGLHTITVEVTDNQNQTTVDTSKSYRTASVYKIGLQTLTNGGIALANAIPTTMFKVYGKATFIDSSNFLLDDGSGNVVRVNAATHNVATGQFATARGSLDLSQSPPVLSTTWPMIQKW